MYILHHNELNNNDNYFKYLFCIGPTFKIP